MNRLRIPMPRYARVSVRPGHQEDIAELVTVTRDVVLKRVKGDAWALWAIAQRQSLPVTIDASITKGLNHNYKRVLLGVAPGAGQMLLQHYLRKVHNDIITCWNFKGEVLRSREFHHMMLCLVQDVHTKPGIQILDNVAAVQRLLIAYTVDLIRVLRELFDITLRPELALAVTWMELRSAFEAYEQSKARQHIHERVCAETHGIALTAEDVGNRVRELLRE